MEQPTINSASVFGTPPAAIPTPPAQVVATVAPAVETPSPVAQPAPAPEVSAVPPANMNLRFPYSSGEVPFDPLLPVLDYPSATREGTLEAIKASPNLSPADDAKLTGYGRHIREGLNQLPMGNDMHETMGREGAKFEQAVVSNGVDLAGFVPRFKIREGGKYSGEAARNLVRSTMNMGTVFSVPLWHSGFWVTLRTPSEGELLELHRVLTQDKTLLGRSTYGLLYSQALTYSSKALVDFIMEHVHSSSLAVDENDSILNYVTSPDFQLLLWGLACATWPGGYQYQRACITAVDKCTHVVNELVNPARLNWTDTSSLTARQINHMANRQKQSVTVEQVKTYASDFLRGNKTKVKLNDTLSIVLKMPMLLEYLNAGFRWISSLEEQYGRAMGMNEEDRNKYLIQHAQAQAMRQHSHFVESIMVDEEVIDDVRDVESILSDLSSDDKIRGTFSELIQKFQNESIISLIAIPNYKCPACGGLQNAKAIPGQKHELIPLDVAQTFFPLLMQKLSAITDR